jgi:5-hydroxyisourate hydrolase
MSGRLTTHVLDMASGRPAQGLVIELFHLSGPDRQLLASTATNADGRCDAPLLSGEALEAGIYELLFHAGDYQRSQGALAGKPLFLDVIPIRFGIADPSAHYHVPLLLSPFGYTTYRGS